MVTSVPLIAFLLVLATPIKIFLIGGAVNENSTLVYSALAKVVPGRNPMPKRCDENWSTTTCPRVAMVTSAAQDEATGNDSYSNDTESLSYSTLLKNYGFVPKHISLHIDNYKTDSNLSTAKGMTNLQIINQADIIYFNGGDQAKHIRAWLNDDGTPNPLLIAVRDRLFKDELIGVGTSAGSMVWANQTFGGGASFGTLYFKNSVGLAPKKVTDGGVNGTGLADTRNGTKSLQYEDNAGKMPAFGFLNFTTDTHFNARGRLGRLVPVLVDLREKLGIGVDENSSLYYNNGVGQVYGWNGVTVCNIEHAIFTPKSYFYMQNVIMHFLTEGDKFDFRSGKVISNKTLITSPAYSGPTDSSSILSAYEATLLETRVVDQRSLYNLGKTKTPSGYPRDTPVFQLKFYKNAATKGYYGNKKYTVEGMLLDFSFGAASNLVSDQ